MKKFLASTTLIFISLLTVATVYAKDKNNEKKLTIPTGAIVTKLKSGTIVINGDTTTAYDKKGNLVYTIQHYPANSLPLDVFKTIRGTYGNYYIAGVEKIEQPGLDDVIFVHMQDNANCKTAKIINGTAEITEEFTKQ